MVGSLIESFVFLRIFEYLRQNGLIRSIPATNKRSGCPYYFLPIKQPLLNGLRSWRLRNHGLPSFPIANKITILDKGSSQTISWAKAAYERSIPDFSGPTASQWTLRHWIVETAADGWLIDWRLPFVDRKERRSTPAQPSPPTYYRQRLFSASNRRSPRLPQSHQFVCLRSHQFVLWILSHFPIIHGRLPTISFRWSPLLEIHCVLACVIFP